MANIPSISSDENSISNDQNQLSDELVSANAEQVTLANKAIPTLEAQCGMWKHIVEAHYPYNYSTQSHYPNTKPSNTRTPKPEFERIDIIPRILVTIPEEDENSSNEIDTDSEDEDETNAKEIDWDDDYFEDDGDEYFMCGVFFIVVIVLTAFFWCVEYFDKL